MAQLLLQCAYVLHRHDQSHSHQNITWSLPQNELRQATNSHTIWIAIQQPPHVLYYFARQHKQDTSTRLWQRSCLSGLGPTFRGCFAQPHAALLVFWLPKGFVCYAEFGRTCARCATSGIVTQGSYWMWCMSTASEHFSRLLCCSGV